MSLLASPSPFRRARSYALALAATFAAAAVGSSAGCSSEETAAPGCVDDKCATGNKCLAFNGETKCRKTCSSNSDAATSCPYGYSCRQMDGAPEPFCVQDQALNLDGTFVTKKETGQWGAPCNASGGIENPDCDTAQGFFCYGTSPSDGAAYCTRYDCETDLNCGAGFWCGKVNTTPNVKTSKRTTVGETQNVCLKRTYCSTCKVDLDCVPIDGVAHRCVPDDDGKGFCTPECASSKNCPNESLCGDPGLGVKICYPRAGRCVGDGSLCAPCRSDADCGSDGACVKGQYTTERTCAKKSTSSCDDGQGRGSCPADVQLKSKVRVLCLGGRVDEVPKDYCHGLYLIGTEGGGDVGCYTPDR